MAGVTVYEGRVDGFLDQLQGIENSGMGRQFDLEGIESLFFSRSVSENLETRFQLESSCIE